MAEPITDACVVGAGICGLAAAYELQKAGLRVLILEEASRVGGVIRSERHGDFLLEGAANTTLSSVSFLELLAELRLERMVLAPNAAAKHKYFVRSRGSSDRPRLVRAPLSPFQFLATPLLSPSAKLRCLREPWVPAGLQEDESVDEFISRRFGGELTKHIVAPALTGIWASDIKRLSARSALPSLWSAERTHGSVLKGFLKRSGGGPTLTLSFTEGLEALPRALHNALRPGTVQLQTRVERIETSETEAVLHAMSAEQASTINARAVIVANDSLSSARLVEPVAANLAGSIRSVAYAPVGLVHLAWEKSAVAHPLDGFGFLVPPHAGLVLLGAVFNSTLFPNRAPTTKHLVTCFVGGMPRPDAADVSQSKNLDRALDEISALLGARERPRVLAARYYERAIPNLGVGHHTLEGAVDELHARESRIRLCGSWLGNMGVRQRIEQGQLAARAIAERLRTSERTTGATDAQRVSR